MVGKRVRGAIYVHRSAVAGLDPAHQKRIEEASAILPDLAWTVARLAPDHTGLMIYEDFSQSAFPALLEAWRIDRQTGRARGQSFRGSKNPLILHRKELLVDDTMADWVIWAELTRQLVARGLFADPHLIGRRQAWDARLSAAGLRLEGQRLCPI